MKIIETFTKGKRGENQNEDGFVITDDYIAVIDGVTSEEKGTTPGRAAMLALSLSVQGFSPNLYEEQIVKELTSVIKDVKIEGAKASVVIFSRVLSRILLIGDCQCMINGILHTNRMKWDEKMTKYRHDYICSLLYEGNVTVDSLLQFDIAREKAKKIMPVKPENIEYAVVNGNEIPIDLVDMYDVPRDAEVVLASDGYPFLCPTLKESEDWLDKVLSIDPLCFMVNQQTKGWYQGQDSYDDRTYVRFVNR